MILAIAPTCATVIGCPPEPTYTGPAVLDAVMCSDFDAVHWRPLGVKDAFNSSDTKVMVFVDVFNGAENEDSHPIDLDWYSPSGAFEGRNHGDLTFDERGWYCAGWMIDGYEAAWNARQGQWRVEVWFMGKLARTVRFTYTE